MTDENEEENGESRTEERSVHRRTSASICSICGRMPLFEFFVFVRHSRLGYHDHRVVFAFPAPERGCEDMRAHLKIAMLLVVLALQGLPAASCPICKGPTGRQVRAGLFDEDFGYHVLATVLPFGIFLGIAAAIRFGPRGGEHHAGRT